MKEVNREYFDKLMVGIAFNSKLSIDNSFLHDPPARMYYDFTLPDDLQYLGKAYMDEDNKRRPTRMRYFIRDDL